MVCWEFYSRDMETKRKGIDLEVQASFLDVL